jgi:VPDSG-CTERM motif
LAINRYGDFTFNDEGGHVGGYIVEIQGRQVPDGGSTLMLLGAALGSIGMIRRKLQK